MVRGSFVPEKMVPWIREVCNDIYNTERLFDFVIINSFGDRTSGIQIPDASAYETGRLGIVALFRTAKETETC